MARLFIAQEVARPANVEIVAGKLKARAERVEIAQHLQSLLRDFGQGHVRLMRQIGIGAQLGPPHAAP